MNYISIRGCGLFYLSAQVFTHCSLLLFRSTADGSSPVTGWTGILIA